MKTNDYIPKWHRELGIIMKVDPVIILSGNVLDVYQYPVDGSTPEGSIIWLPAYLHYFFKDAGCSNIVFYDTFQGFHNDCNPEAVAAFFADSPRKSRRWGYSRGISRHSGGKRRAHRQTCHGPEPAAHRCCDRHGFRYIASPDTLSQDEVNAYTELIKASLEAKEVRSEKQGTLKNLLVLIVNKVNDLPSWFYLQNPNSKTIRIGPPSKEEK